MLGGGGFPLSYAEMQLHRTHPVILPEGVSPMVCVKFLRLSENFRKAKRSGVEESANSYRFIISYVITQLRLYHLRIYYSDNPSQIPRQARNDIGVGVAAYPLYSGGFLRFAHFVRFGRNDIEVAVLSPISSHPRSSP